jgi:putative transposase
MMPKVDDIDHINFLIAAQRTFTCTEASRDQPRPPEQDSSKTSPAHDSFNRLLERSFHDRDSLWGEAKPLVSLRGGILVVDVTSLDKAGDLENILQLIVC